MTTVPHLTYRLQTEPKRRKPDWKQYLGIKSLTAMREWVLKEFQAPTCNLKTKAHCTKKEKKVIKKAKKQTYADLSAEIDIAEASLKEAKAEKQKVSKEQIDSIKRIPQLKKMIGRKEEGAVEELAAEKKKQSKQKKKLNKVGEKMRDIERKIVMLMALRKKKPPPPKEETKPEEEETKPETEETKPEKEEM